MACPKLNKVSHVIFDMDGVLLDTESLYTKATQSIVEKFGKTYDWSVKTQVMGLTGEECSKAIVNLLDLPITPQEYYKLSHAHTIAKQYGKIYSPQVQGKLLGTVERESARIAVTEMGLPISCENFQRQFRSLAHKLMINNSVPLMPGAEQLVKHLRKHNVPIAVATSSGLDSFNLKTSKHKDFFSLFDHIVCGGTDSEVKSGKPSPDIFLVCASRFASKPKAEDCLVFEDAPNGVTAAVKAGMQVVMIPDDNVPKELRKDANVEIQRLLEVKLDLFGLPPLTHL